jgi:hypothetical protein
MSLLAIVWVLAPVSGVLAQDYGYWDSCPDDMVINVTMPGIYTGLSSGDYGARACYLWNVRVTQTQGRALNFGSVWMGLPPSTSEQCIGSGIFYEVAVPNGDGSYTIVGAEGLQGQWVDSYGCEFVTVSGTRNVVLPTASHDAYRIKVRAVDANGAPRPASVLIAVDLMR